MSNLVARRRRALTVLLVVGAVAYAAWLAEFLLPTGLPPLRAYVSELAARGRPYSAFFRATDLVAATVLAAWAIGDLWLNPRARLSQRRSHLLLLVFALGTAADALSPMPCAPTLSPGCEAARGSAMAGVLHEVTSVAASASFLALVWVGVWMVLRRPRDGRAVPHASARLKVAVLGLAVGYTGATLWTTVEIARHELWGTPVRRLLIGLAQRIQLSVMSIWLMLQAFRVWRVTQPQVSPGR